MRDIFSNLSLATSLILFLSPSYVVADESSEQIATVMDMDVDNKDNSNLQAMYTKNASNITIQTTGTGSKTIAVFQNVSLTNGSFIASTGGANTVSFSGSNGGTLGTTSIMASSMGSNTITAMDGLGITAQSVVSDGGSNTITASTGSISKVMSSSGSNTISFTQSGVVSEIEAASGSNILNLSGSSEVSNADSTAMIEATGGSNRINLSGSSSLKNVEIVSSGGINTILGNTTAKSSISKIESSGGSNSLTLKSADVKEIVAARGTNTVSISSGSIDSITASAGRNIVSLENGSIKKIDAMGGSNQVTIASATIESLEASSNGANTVGITNSGDLGNVIAKGGTNNLTLSGNSKITGFISSSDVGINNVTLNGGSSLVNNGTYAAGYENVVIVSDGANSRNIFTGNTQGSSSIVGNILASNSGMNSLTLNSLSLSGDLLAKSAGSNVLNLQSGSLMNVSADGSNSKNTLNISNVKIEGKVSALQEGNNMLTLTRGSSISGSLESNSGSNSVSLSNSNFSGYLLAQNGGTNEIVLLNESYLNLDGSTTVNSIRGSVLAIGTGSSNTIRSNQDVQSDGMISRNIVASELGTNSIEVEGMDVAGSILASSGGMNTIVFRSGGHISGIRSSDMNSHNGIQLGGMAEQMGIISATKSGKNTITLSDNTSINGNVMASESGVNEISSSGNSLLNVNVEVQSSGENSIHMTDQSVLTGEVKALGGSNTLDMKDSSKLMGNVIASGGSNTLTLAGKANVNGFILSDSSNGMNTVYLNENAFIHAESSGDTSAIQASANNASNTIKDSGSGENVIKGNILANQGSNEISLNILKMTGDVVATNGGSNKISLSSSELESVSSIEGNILSTGNNSKNILTFYNTSIKGDMTAQDSGMNTLGLYGQESTGVFLSKNSGSNIIYLGDEQRKTVLTGSIQSESMGENTITVVNTTISDGIFANENGSNKVFIQSIKETQTSSNITANASGVNTIMFSDAYLIGDITANASGMNTITDTGSNWLDGNVMASGEKSKNALSINNFNITKNILAEGGGSNVVDKIEQKLYATQINSMSSSSNIITNTKGELETTYLSAVGSDAMNSISLQGSSNINFHYNITLQEDLPKQDSDMGQDNSLGQDVDLAGDMGLDQNPDFMQPTPQEENKIVILADGLGAKNTILDSTPGTDNRITGFIQASNKGENILTLNRLTQVGSIIAEENGKNSIVFGKQSASISTMQEAHVISKIGENNLTLENLNFEGSMQALLQGSKNEIKLTSGSFEGYLWAISDSPDMTQKDSVVEQQGEDTGSEDNWATNTLTLDSTSSIHLIGSQVMDALSNGRGTGKDAIYTEGDKAKNTINYIGDYIIEGNITAYNYGTNTFDFHNKVNMTGSLHAQNTKNDPEFITSNTITLNNDSVIQDGYVLSMGANTKNTLTLKDNSVLQNSYIQAQSSGGFDAINSIDVQSSSSIQLRAPSEGRDAVLAMNVSAQNFIMGDTTGNNSITGIIRASNGGRNVINLLYLNVEGNIIGSNAGINTITVTSTDSKDGVFTNTFNGSIIQALGNGRNNLSLSDTSLKYKQVVANGVGALNTIVMTHTSEFEINNGSNLSIYANFQQAKNTIEGITGKIVGDVLASNSGINQIHTSSSLSIEGGFISASGATSMNNISSEVLTFSLNGDRNDENAVFAGGIGAINNISTVNYNSGNSKIDGNILSTTSGINNISIGNIAINGSIIANSAGQNNLGVGEEISMDVATIFTNTQPNPQDGGTFMGGVYALHTGSENKIYFYSPSSLLFSVNPGFGGVGVYDGGVLTSPPGSFGYAILSSGLNSKNTIVAKSKEDSKMMGDIGAVDSGVNHLVLDYLDISKVSIVAENGGNNTLTVTHASHMDFGILYALGSNSLNTFASFDYANTQGGFQDGVGSLSGLMWAEGGGSNDVRVRLLNSSEKVNVNVTTHNLSSNTLVVQNVTSASSVIRYIGGNTAILFAGSNTAVNMPRTDIRTTDVYYSGIYLTPDAESADELLREFRSYDDVKENMAKVEMINNNTFNFSGVYIGGITFLDDTTSEDNASTVSMNPNVTINPNSILAAGIRYGTSGFMNLTLNSGSRWIMTPSSITNYTINDLIGNTGITYDPSSAANSSFISRNAIVDIATGGMNTRFNLIKNDTFSTADYYTRLTVKNASNLNNVIFRLYANTVDPKADYVLIEGASSTAKTESAKLQVFYSAESLRNATVYNALGDDEKIKIATVQNGAKDNFSFDTSKTTVRQSYVLVTTDFFKKTEEESGALVDNYYIQDYDVRLDPRQVSRSFSVLGVNYLVFLANTNNINKRLGEKREKDKADSLWIRAYGGQITQSFGDRVTNNYVSTQGGYDYGIRSKSAMHYLGIASGYGMNFLSTQEAKLNSQLFSAALYYSYVRDSGLYVDSIIKYDYINTNPYGFPDFRSYLKSNVVSWTEEIGYRFYMARDHVYMDIGAEGIVGYLQGYRVLQFDGESTLVGEVNDFFAFRGRGYLTLSYGFNVGKSRTDFRVGGAYVADYTTMRLNVASLEFGASQSYTPPYNQMVVGVVGINSKITSSLRIYMEAEMGFLGRSINQTWAANFGIQYAFGSTSETNYAVNQDNEIPVKNIDAPNIRCAGCNPESGLYLELISLARENSSLNAYIAEYSYRVYKESDNARVIYYIGPYKSEDDANSAMQSVNKMLRTLTKNEESKSSLVRIVNKSRR